MFSADTVLRAPLSDGGAGFVDVMHAALGGDLLAATVPGPLGKPVPATMLAVTDHRRRDGQSDQQPSRLTIFLDLAQVCGPELVDPGIDVPSRRSEPAELSLIEVASSRGAGELIQAGLDAGADRIVVGVGAMGPLDGGAGLLDSLGAVATPTTAMQRGGRGLAEVESVALGPARDRVLGVDLVMMTEAAEPLLGMQGVANLIGSAHGLDLQGRVAVDGWLTRFAQLADYETAKLPGAGAAGGVGYAMLLLGAYRQPGLAGVAELTGAAEAIKSADLVLTGASHLGPQQMDRGVLGGVASLCQAAGTPCVALCLTTDLSAREHRAAGMDALYSAVDIFGADAADERPDRVLRRLATRVARTWGRR